MSAVTSTPRPLHTALTSALAVNLVKKEVVTSDRRSRPVSFPEGVCKVLNLLSNTSICYQITACELTSLDASDTIQQWTTQDWTASI